MKEFQRDNEIKANRKNTLDTSEKLKIDSLSN